MQYPNNRQLLEGLGEQSSRGWHVCHLYKIASSKTPGAPNKHIAKHNPHPHPHPAPNAAHRNGKLKKNLLNLFLPLPRADLHLILPKNTRLLWWWEGCSQHTHSRPSVALRHLPVPRSWTGTTWDTSRGITKRGNFRHPLQHASHPPLAHLYEQEVTPPADIGSNSFAIWVQVLKQLVRHLGRS